MRVFDLLNRIYFCLNQKLQQICLAVSFVIR